MELRQGLRTGGGILGGPSSSACDCDGEAGHGQPGNGLAHRGGRLLAAIEERGGEVTTDEFYRLGKECGYADLRGLGGFFNGEQRSLEVVSETGNRKLTPIGKGHAERWQKKYGPARLG